jgi:hypothetical protein
MSTTCRRRLTTTRHNNDRMWHERPRLEQTGDTPVMCAQVYWYMWHLFFPSTDNFLESAQKRLSYCTIATLPTTLAFKLAEDVLALEAAIGGIFYRYGPAGTTFSVENWCLLGRPSVRTRRTLRLSGVQNRAGYGPYRMGLPFPLPLPWYHGTELYDDGIRLASKCTIVPHQVRGTSIAIIWEEKLL